MRTTNLVIYWSERKKFWNQVVAKTIVPDDIYQVRAAVSQWIIDADIQVIVSTGGTGVTGRDGTPEAIRPLLGNLDLENV